MTQAPNQLHSLLDLKVWRAFTRAEMLEYVQGLSGKKAMKNKKSKSKKKAGKKETKPVQRPLRSHASEAG